MPALAPRPGSSRLEGMGHPDDTSNPSPPLRNTLVLATSTLQSDFCQKMFMIKFMSSHLAFWKNDSRDIEDAAALFLFRSLCSLAPPMLVCTELQPVRLHTIHEDWKESNSAINSHWSIEWLCFVIHDIIYLTSWRYPAQVEPQKDMQCHQQTCSAIDINL